MPPATLDLELTQGDTYRRRFTVTDVDITAWSFLAQIRTGAADNTTVEASFTTTIIDGPTGVFEIVLAPADSATLNPEVVHFWDLEATTNTGDVVTLVSGQVTVTAEISRPVPSP